MIKDKFIPRKQDTYTVSELLLKPRTIFFIPNGKTDAYYKMSNGEYGYFCGKVKEIEVNANVKMDIKKEGIYIGPCHAPEIAVTIQGNKLYVR